MDPWPYIIFPVITVFAALIEFSTKAVLSQNQLNVKKLFPEDEERIQPLIDALEDNRFQQKAEFSSLVCFILASFVSSAWFVLKFASKGFFSAIDPIASVILSFLIVCVATLFILLVFAKGFPAKLGLKHSDSLCLVFLPFLKFSTAIFAPLYYVFDFVASLFAMLTGAKPEEIVEDVTEGEIRQMIDEGMESGSIEESENTMIHGIFEFDDRTVGEILTHRTEVTAVEVGTSLSEIVQVIASNGFSRIPVYRESLDDVIGLLYVKDLLPLIGKSDSEFVLEDYVREALYIPETNSLKELFEKFKSARIQMAIVVDEYGGTLGIATMEDLIESIMGSISDEYDDEDDAEEESRIMRISETEFIVNGLCLVKEIEEELGISIRNDEECDTIGGLAVSLIGIIPSEGEHPEAELENITFKVISVVEHRVDKLQLTIIDEKTDGGEEDASVSDAND